jgi:uncharacterized protein GlcG (DUF336 family)
VSELTLALAELACDAAMKRAEVLGVAISVAVVDQSGRTVLIKRGDGTGFLTPDFALGKAVGAAGFRRPTKAVAEAWERIPAFWTSALHAASSHFMPATGAVPLLIGDRLVGAIGCGGAHPDQDHECAEMGAAAIHDATSTR